MIDEVLLLDVLAVSARKEILVILNCKELPGKIAPDTETNSYEANYLNSCAGLSV